MMELRSLPREQVMAAWPAIAPILGRVVGLDGREDLLDVAGALLMGRYHALIVVDEDKSVCVCVVQIEQYRHGKVAQIVYIAGDGLTDWISYLDSIENWCKAQECISVEGTGRAGWEHVLASRGYTRTSSTLRKRL